MEVVVATGEPAPGAHGARFGNGFHPVINDRGDVAFSSTLVGPGTTSVNDWALFGPDRAGRLVLLAREGTPVPGTNAVFGDRLYDYPHVNDTGRVAFSARLVGSDPSALDVGIFRTDPSGRVKLIMRTGDPAPFAFPGSVFQFGTHPTLNNQGELIFRGAVTNLPPPLNTTGSIWRVSPTGRITPVALPGDQAAGLPEGVRFSGTFTVPVLQDRGDFIFGATLVPGILSPRATGIWRATRASGLEFLAGATQPSPETGETLIGAHNAVDNKAFEYAFLESPSESFNHRLWVKRRGSRHATPVITTGEPVPGQPDGVFHAALSKPVLSEGGRVLIKSALTGPATSFGNRAAIISVDPFEAPRLLFRSGEQVPGQPAGTVFTDEVTHHYGTTARGDFAFSSRFLDINDPSNLRVQAVVFVAASGEGLSIVRVGDWIELAPGIWKQVQWFGWIASSDGLRGMNERRVLAVGLLFEDDTTAITRVRVGESFEVSTDSTTPDSQDIRLRVTGEDVPAETDVEAIDLCLARETSDSACHRPTRVNTMNDEQGEGLVLSFSRAQVEASWVDRSRHLTGGIEGTRGDGTFFWTSEFTVISVPPQP
jgi:hypothetical protein